MNNLDKIDSVIVDAGALKALKKIYIQKTKLSLHHILVKPHTY